MKNMIKILALVLTINVVQAQAVVHPKNRSAEKHKGTVKANGIAIAFEGSGKEQHEAIVMIQGIGLN